MATRSDLTGFAALLGEGFASRVDLLAQVIQDAHYPSLGSYKERLLSETIRNYLPRSVEVGTGFVLFPHEDTAPPGGKAHHDPLNRSAFTISRQCDILVFDSATYPPVFRDGDFVVLRPESVRAVIEVKGSLNAAETRSLVASFIDFGRKWRATQAFYRLQHQRPTQAPMLAAMAWSIAKRRTGKFETNSAKIRGYIADAYGQAVPKEELDDFPLLEHLMIYAEAEISLIYGNDEFGVMPMHLGWHAQDGRFHRFDQDGRVYRDKDRTIASLLASLHIATGWDTFNRFFSYTDETRDHTLLPYSHSGSTWCWYDLEHVQRLGPRDEA